MKNGLATTGSLAKCLRLVSSYHIGPLNAFILSVASFAATLFGWTGVQSAVGMYVWATAFGITSGAASGAFLAAAASLSVPMLWLVARLSLRRTLLISAAIQLAGVLLFALADSPLLLLAAGALTGVAAVLFEISASPFMMRHSDQQTRDHLFSANAAIRIGVPCSSVPDTMRTS